MSRGKYLSLEEARKLKQLDRFAKEHPSEGDKSLFDKLFSAMAKKPVKASRTSRKASMAISLPVNKWATLQTMGSIK